MAIIISSEDIDVSRILTNPTTNEKYQVDINFKEGKVIESNEPEVETYFAALIGSYPTRYFGSKEAYEKYLTEKKKSAQKVSSLKVVKLGEEREPEKPVIGFDPFQVDINKESLERYDVVQLKMVGLAIGLSSPQNIGKETLIQRILEHAKKIAETEDQESEEEKSEE